MCSGYARFACGNFGQSGAIRLHVTRGDLRFYRTTPGSVCRRAGLPCAPFGVKTSWDVYLEVRSSSHSRTPGELGAVLSTDGASTRQALAALDKAQLVYSAVIGGVHVAYVVGKDAGTDDEALGSRCDGRAGYFDGSRAVRQLKRVGGRFLRNILILVMPRMFSVVARTVTPLA